MIVYALIGHSGTGKSHQAPILARQYNIDYLIDDGLLIKGNMILGGRSAKRENTRFGAIKRALFNDQDQAKQVKEQLAEAKPESIMILGTSRRMTEVIAHNLELPVPNCFFTIEEVSDPESIKNALKQRAEENRHVIPLPTFAIKKDFPGYIIDPLRTFFSLASSESSKLPVERSVVRPIFSSMGSFYIAEHVINDLVRNILSKIAGIHKVIHVDLENGSSKVYLHIDLEIDLGQIPNMRIDHLLYEAQRSVKEEIEYLTGFYLDQVNVYARRLHMEDSLLKNKKKLHGIVTSSKHSDSVR